MIEIVTQRASLVGQVIEDLTYEALSPRRFKAELTNVKKSPQYKQGGFFVFSDLAPENYTLRIFGERFQPLEYSVTIPPPNLVIDSAGDNELFVIVRTINDAGNNNGNKRITFDPVILNKEIRAGARVLAQGFSTELAAELDVGRNTQAKLDNVAGLTEGSIVRIIRDRSIRLKFDPYSSRPSELTRIVGQVVLKDAPEIPLEGVQVRLTQVNGVNIVLNDVAGANIATVEIDETQTILGAEKDITTMANQKGDYNLYFSQDDFLENITLVATLSGYQPETKTEPIRAGQRKKIDFQLTSFEESNSNEGCLEALKRRFRHPLRGRSSTR